MLINNIIANKNDNIYGATQFIPETTCLVIIELFLAERSQTKWNLERERIQLKLNIDSESL